MNWEQQAANPIALNWSSSITNSSNELIHVGNSLVPNEGANLIVTKYDRSGSLMWQSNFNSQNTNGDFGIKATTDSQGNIYVIGTTDNSTVDNYDIIVLKYSSGGNLIWSLTYDSNNSLNDVPTGIVLDQNGNVYVCGTSKSVLDEEDYLLLKIDGTGNILWTSSYDFNSLSDIATDLYIDGSGNIYVIGASAASLTDWDYTLTKFDASGNILGDVRNTIPGTNFDKPSSFVQDNFGNIYITGKSSTNGINYNIKTVKLNSSFQIEWEQVIDFTGNEDVGIAIDTDQSGDIVIGGFVTENLRRYAFTVKYAPDGTELWQRVQRPLKIFNNLNVQAIDVTNNGDMYVLSFQNATGNQAPEGGFVSKIDANGNLLWQKSLESYSNFRPMTINQSLDGSIYVTAIHNNTYTAINFSELEMDADIVYDNQKPFYKSNELIVRFNQNTLLQSSIDNSGLPLRKIEFAPLEYFLTPSAMQAIDEALKNVCSSDDKTPNPCQIIGVKIFKEMTTSQTTIISNTGETVPLPDFYNSLLIKFPPQMNIFDIQNALKTITDVVAFSEPNFFFEATSIPNDPIFPNQSSLNNFSYPERAINIDEAWDIMPSGGKSYIKCGVFDAGIDYTHPDFGYISSDPNSGKIMGGWSFQENVPLKNSMISDDGHGTPVAGIIGAIRNNNLGIAGIAGGNYSAGSGYTNQGISLYGLRIFNSPPGSFFPQYNNLYYVYDALVSSVLSSDAGSYTYDLDLSNHSWQLVANSFPHWIDTNINLLRQCFHIVNRKGMTTVASGGNQGLYGNPKGYPAHIDDDWVLTVSGTGNNGGYKDKFNGGQEWEPTRNKLVDVAVPSIDNFVYTTSVGGGYQNFGQTSSAAPHVTGVAGLILSYLNDSVVSYKNLVHEDVERIIELSAVDTDMPGPDSLTGYGRLDAGAAMQLIEFPINRVIHFGTSDSSQSTNHKMIILEESNKPILLRENFERADDHQWFLRGDYIVNVYKITHTFSHVLPNNHQIVAYWPRPSSSDEFEELIGDSLLPRERLKMINCDNFSSVIEGYAYEVFDINNNPLGWWPYNPYTINPKVEYTVLCRDITASVDDLNENKNILVYPNPSINSNTILLKGENGKQVNIKLYDVQGRLIKTIYNGMIDSDSFSFSTNIESLDSAMYFYKIQINDEIELLRFIKQ